jgi:hypothetical protein
MVKVALQKGCQGKLWRGVWGTRLRWAQLLTQRRNERMGRRLMDLALGARQPVAPPVEPAEPPDSPPTPTSPTSPNPEWRPGAIVLMPRDAGHPQGAITLYRKGSVHNDGTVHRNHPAAPPQYGFEEQLSWVIRAGMQRHGHLPQT